MGVQRSVVGVRGGVIAGVLVLACEGATTSVEGGASSGSSSGIGTGSGTNDTSAGAGESSAGADSSSSDTSTSSSSGALDSSTGEHDTPPAELEEGELLPGGATTVDEHGIGAFVQRADNLTILGSSAFQAGLQFVQLDWEPAPGTAELDGLGPTYNAISCIACHVRNGRGVVVDDDAPVDPVLLRLVRDDALPDPSYGDQLQPRGVPGVVGEGTPVRTDAPARSHVFDDGERVVLSRPYYEIDALAFGPLADATVISPRITPQLVGMGLLEAIEEDDILAWADPDDLDGDGIAGRPGSGGDGELARFGWRATQPRVLDQVAAAFAGDLGITNSIHPLPDCPAPQQGCADAPTGGALEINDTRLGVTAAYVRLLGVPSRRGGDDDEVLRGKTLFALAGCDGCHRPSYVTGDAEDPELADQLIWPYTDLLLHDMGDGLADEGVDDGRLWRTPPLWGLGLVETVGGARDLLHDGRASTLTEAILWHDGEAAAAREVYEGFDALARARLQLFVESL